MTSYDGLPLMLEVSDLAELWRCSERTASQWCADHERTPSNDSGVAFKIGRGWRVPKDAVIPPPAGSPEVDQLRAENTRLRERVAALEGVLAAIETTAATAKDTAL